MGSPIPVQVHAASVWSTYKLDKSATRTDMAVLVSAVFLQRFSLPFGAARLTFDFAAIVLILLYQFLCGKLLIQYDRLLWFLSLALANTLSLLLNFEKSSLTAYFLVLVINSMLMLSRPSTPDRYNRTLQVFQLLVLFLSCLGVVQFVAQFAINGKDLMNFYGIVPEFLLLEGVLYEPRNFGGIIKSNAIFFREPSIYSQFTALGILIEVLEFRRPRYLFVIALGFLVGYSGTGLVLLLLFVPFATLTHDKAGFSVLLVAMFALGLVATGIIQLSEFTSRVGEFEEPGSSAFIRFVAPIWATTEHFHIASLQALLVGAGPGGAKSISVASWFRLFYEYGIIGSFIYLCFLASCLRRTRCPGVVVAAMIFAHFFLMTTVYVVIVLCTLSGRRPLRGRIDEISQYRSSLVAGAETV